VRASIWVKHFLALIVVAAFAAPAFSQEQIKPIPPAGIQVSPQDRAELEAQVKNLGNEIAALPQTLKNKPALLELLPDVQIFHNAARYALTYNEFFNAREIPAAKKLIQDGLDRAKSLREGQAAVDEGIGADCSRLCVAN